jgi:hypothetical protein
MPNPLHSVFAIPTLNRLADRKNTIKLKAGICPTDVSHYFIIILFYNILTNILLFYYKIWGKSCDFRGFSWIFITNFNEHRLERLAQIITIDCPNQNKTHQPAPITTDATDQHQHRPMTTNARHHHQGTTTSQHRPMHQHQPTKSLPYKEQIKILKIGVEIVSQTI